MNKLRGVLLDIDGTLIDSNDGHAHAWVESLREAGFEVPFERVRELIGKGGDKVLPEVTDGLQADSDKGKAIAKRRSAIFKEQYLPHVRAFPQTRDLLLQMRERGLKLVVATSAQPDEMEPLLQIAGAADLVEERASSKDAKESKPEPDIVQAALERGGLSAGEVVMLGDTPYDVEAAGRAGVAAIALRCGGWQDADLKGAVAIYDDPSDLLRNYDGSPLTQ